LSLFFKELERKILVFYDKYSDSSSIKALRGLITYIPGANSISGPMVEDFNAKSNLNWCEIK